jgi:hypothetical protein
MEASALITAPIEADVRAEVGASGFVPAAAVPRDSIDDAAAAFAPAVAVVSDVGEETADPRESLSADEQQARLDELKGIARAQRHAERLAGLPPR